MPNIQRTFVCESCGERFDRDGTRPYLYCSRACYHRSRIGRQQNREPREKRAPKLLTRTCSWCGDQFQSASSAGARTRFCSRSCQGYAQASPDKSKSLPPTVAAYLAAIVDGEGSIMVIDRTKDRPKSTRPTIKVMIVNTYRPLLEWIVEQTSLGQVRLHTAKQRGVVQGRKPIYYWSATSLGAISLLQQLVPYLLEKRERAEAAIVSQTKAAHVPTEPY